MRLEVLAVQHAEEVEPLITDWISAGSTLALVALGLFTVWQWWASGFRPKILSARIDGLRQAVEVRVKNRGRASGTVQQVVIVTEKSGLFVECHHGSKFSGFENDEFQSFVLPGQSEARIVVAISEDAPFNMCCSHVLAIIGDRVVTERLRLAKGVSLFGLESILPSEVGLGIDQ